MDKDVKQGLMVIVIIAVIAIGGFAAAATMHNRDVKESQNAAMQLQEDAKMKKEAESAKMEKEQEAAMQKAEGDAMQKTDTAAPANQ